MNAKEINRYEWDFDSCPANEFELCFEYERSRDTPEVRKDAEDWRRQCLKYANSPWVDQPPGATFDDYWQRANYSLLAWYYYEQFPSAPYLTISPEERNRRLAKIKEVGIDPIAIEDDGSWFQEGFSNLLAEYGDLTSDGTSHHGSKYQADGSTIFDGNSTFAAFHFDWTRSDRTYIEALKLWLRHNRNRSVKVIPPFRDDLKSKLHQLGAWRLLNKYAMTWKEAEDMTQQIRDDHKPLYSGQPSWIRARNEADRFLGMAAR